MFFILRGNMDCQIIIIIFITSYWTSYVDSQINLKDGLTNLKLFDNHFIEHRIRKREVTTQSTIRPTINHLLSSTEESQDKSSTTDNIEIIQTVNSINASNNDSTNSSTDTITTTTASMVDLSTTSSPEITEVLSSTSELTTTPNSSIATTPDPTDVDLPRTTITPRFITIRTSHSPTTEINNLTETANTNNQTNITQSYQPPTSKSTNAEHLNVTSSSTNSTPLNIPTTNNVQTTTVSNPTSTSSTKTIEPSSTNSNHTDTPTTIEKTLNNNFSTATQKHTTGNTEGIVISTTMSSTNRESHTTKSYSTTVETINVTESSTPTQTTINSSTSILGSTRPEIVSTSPTSNSTSVLETINAPTTKSTSTTRNETTNPINTSTSIDTKLSTTISTTVIQSINTTLSTLTTKSIDNTTLSTTGNEAKTDPTSTTRINPSTKVSVPTPIPDLCLSTGNEVCHKEQKVCFAINGTFECRCPIAYLEKNNTCVLGKYIYEVNLKLNRTFTEALNDPNSEEYVKLYSEVMQMLKEKFEKEDIHITSITFSNGSIKVHLITATEKEYTPETLHNTVHGIIYLCNDNTCLNFVPQSIEVNQKVNPCNDSTIIQCPQLSVCVHSSNSLSCECLPGTTADGTGYSKKCVTVCQDKNPCQNNAKCSPTYINPYFVCKCPDAFEGDTCENAIGKSAEVISLTTTLYIVIGVGGGFIFLLIIVVLCMCCRRRKHNGTNPFSEPHYYNAIGLENYKPTGRLRARLSQDLTAEMREINEYDEAEPKRMQQTKLTTFERRPSKEGYYSGIDNPALNKSNDKFNGYK